MKEESVVVPAGQFKLEGLFARPPGNTAPAAVECHPHPLYGGSMHNNVVEAILEATWQLGFATLRFNFRGVGASEGEHSGGAGEIEDANAAMRFILAQRGVASDGALMAGYSFGAAIAMRAGMDIQEVATIAAVALPVGMGNFSSDGRPSKQLVFVAGDRDTYCPKPAISELAKKEGARLKIIEGVDHFFGGGEAALTAALIELLGA